MDVEGVGGGLWRWGDGVRVVGLVVGVRDGVAVTHCGLPL